jgi:hypothetical protein
MLKDARCRRTEILTPTGVIPVHPAVCQMAIAHLAVIRVGVESERSLDGRCTVGSGRIFCVLGSPVCVARNQGHENTGLCRRTGRFPGAVFPVVTAGRLYGRGVFRAAESHGLAASSRLLCGRPDDCCDHGALDAAGCFMRRPIRKAVCSSGHQICGVNNAEFFPPLEDQRHLPAMPAPPRLQLLVGHEFIDHPTAALPALPPVLSPAGPRGMVSVFPVLPRWPLVPRPLAARHPVHAGIHPAGWGLHPIAVPAGVRPPIRMTAARIKV